MSSEDYLNKSPSQEPKDPESLKKSQDSSSTSSSSNSQDNQELLNHPYVQDLLLKIDVLKRGIFKERKTNQDLSAKLKKFEAELTSKIVALEEYRRSSNEDYITSGQFKTDYKWVKRMMEERKAPEIQREQLNTVVQNATLRFPQISNEQNFLFEKNEHGIAIDD